jgi:hypothetical protein
MSQAPLETLERLRAQTREHAQHALSAAERALRLAEVAHTEAQRAAREARRRVEAARTRAQLGDTPEELTWAEQHARGLELENAARCAAVQRSAARLSELRLTRDVCRERLSVAETERKVVERALDRRREQTRTQAERAAEEEAEDQHRARRR